MSSQQAELQSLEHLLAKIHPDDLPGVLAKYQRSVTEGADFDHEFRIVRTDGRERGLPEIPADRERITRAGTTFRFTRPA